MITITNSAKNYLKRIANGKLVALSVKSGGCSGFQYCWDLIDNIDENYDGPFDDIIVVDKISVMYILGSTIDYVESLEGNYLTVVNKLAKSQCGCGESFNV